MKNLTIVLIVLIFSSFSFADDHKTGCIEKFGTQIFKLLQSGEFDKILEQTPTSHDFVFIINNSAFPDEQKAGMTSQSENQASGFKESLKKSIDVFQVNSNNASINWADYSIDYIDFEHKRKDKIEDVDIYLFVSYKDVTHKIGLHDCLKSDGKWLMGNEIYWKGQ